MKATSIQTIDWQLNTININDNEYRFTLQQRQIHGRRYIYAHLRIGDKVHNIYLGKVGQRWRDRVL